MANSDAKGKPTFRRDGFGSSRGKKYAKELKQRCNTNGEVLTPQGASYRMGYLTARKDATASRKHVRRNPDKYSDKKIFFGGKK